MKAKRIGYERVESVEALPVNVDGRGPYQVFLERLSCGHNQYHGPHPRGRPLRRRCVECVKKAAGGAGI
jgi:hypothetical protein